jgi:hypothetical protein
VNEADRDSRFSPKPATPAPGRHEQSRMRTFGAAIALTLLVASFGAGDG